MKSNAKAFTLIELLTVVAIIGILAAILIPTVGAVKRRAVTSQCGSNLRQLGMALNLYANDNKETLPDGTLGSASLQWLHTDIRDALMKYGLTWEMFFCRGNSTYTATWMTEVQRAKRNTPVPIGYVYLPGNSYTFPGPNGPVPSKYKQTKLPKIQYRLLAADLNRKWQNSFQDGMNHSDSSAPFGANHLYIDGSVKWFGASAFIDRPAVSGGGTEYYFKTED